MILRSLRVFATAVLLAAMVVGAGGCINVSGAFGPGDIREVVYEQGGSFSPAKVAIIDVSGVISGGGEGESFFDSDSTVVSLSKKLRRAGEDPRVKAVILRIDSPGGGVNASDTMHREVVRFRQETGIPVYASMQTLAASGGYYVAMACDQVYAHPTTVTGSIGVISVFPGADGLMGKIGLNMNAITTGKYKDSGAFYRDFTADDRAYYQAIIDDMYARFLEVVAANRTNLDAETIRGLADGRVYTANQALDAGLIDGIQYLDELVETVAKENKLRNPRVVIYKRSSAPTTDSLYARTPAPSTTYSLVNIDVDARLEASGESFNYLWVP